MVAERRRAEFPAAADAAARARHWLRPMLPAHARQAGMVAISEVVTNALVHSRLAADDTLEVLVTCAGDARLRVSVRHRGTAFATPPAPQHGQIGGWGLHLVETLTEAWGVDSGNGHAIVVWFEL